MIPEADRGLNRDPRLFAREGYCVFPRVFDDAGVAARGLRRRDDEVRIDLRPDDTEYDFARGSMTRETRPCVTYWFPLTAELCVRGENRLGLTLTASDPDAADSIVVEEVEVFVMPSFERHS